MTRLWPSLLAVLFVTASCAQDPAASVTVPAARHASATAGLESRWTEELVMRHDGNLFRGDERQMNFAATLARVANDMSKQEILPGDRESPVLPDDWLHLRVDEDVAFQHVAKLLAACSKEHVRKLAFATPVEGEVRTLLPPVDLGIDHGTEESSLTVRIGTDEPVTLASLAAQLPDAVPAYATLRVEALLPWSEVVKAMDLLVDLGMDVDLVYPQLARAH